MIYAPHSFNSSSVMCVSLVSLLAIPSLLWGQAERPVFDDEAIIETIVIGTCIPPDRLRAAFDRVARGLTPIVWRHGSPAQFSFEREHSRQEQIAVEFVNNLVEAAYIGLAVDTGQTKVVSVCVDTEDITRLAGRFTASFARQAFGMVRDVVEVKAFSAVCPRSKDFRIASNPLLRSRAGHLIDWRARLVWANGPLQDLSRWPSKRDIWRLIPSLGDWRIPTKIELEKLLSLASGRSYLESFLGKKGCLWSLDEAGPNDGWAFQLEEPHIVSIPRTSECVVLPVVDIPEAG